MSGQPRANDGGATSLAATRGTTTGAAGTASQVMLLTRAWPASEARSGFDDWQRTRHIPEIVSSGLLQGASYWVAPEANSGVAPPWVLPGLRMACYYGADAAQMETWFSSAGLGDAIEDGSSWFDNFHRLDGQLFTGNVYECAGGRPSERGGDAVLVDRWESGEETPEAGTSVEAAQRYCNTLANLGGVVCSTVWRTVKWPVAVSYYRSLGSRMVWTEFDSLEALRSSLAAGQLAAAATALQPALVGAATARTKCSSAGSRSNPMIE